MRLVDVSASLTASTTVWPGDTNLTVQPKWSINDGASVNVSTVTTTTHIGTHIDAPSHVRAGAADISKIPLDSCVGDSLVVDIADLVDRSTSPHGHAPAARVIERIHQTLAGQDLPPRLLLAHRTTAVTEWDAETPGVDPHFIEWFAAHGGLLIGIDLLSFDPEVSTELLAHHACIDAGIVMLEGLDLTHADPGPAELFALPIPWQGADAAPVRAVLRYQD